MAMFHYCSVVLLLSSLTGTLSQKCKKPWATVGTVIVKDCLSRECVKQGRKGVWEESFSSTTCCSFQRRGFKVGEEIKSFTAADGCTQVSLFCSDQTGAPDVDVSVVSECTTGAATEESMMNSFEAVTDMLHLILNETGKCCSAPPAPPAPTTPPNYGSQCGVVNKDRIIGGQETSPYKYPWQAMLFNRQGWPFCGGSIISSRVILTAAHCTAGTAAGDIGVAVGVHDFVNGEVSETMRAESKQEHPNYNSVTFDFDIALLLLPQNLTFSKRVQRVCLPPTPLPYDGYSATVSGWGLTDGNDQSSVPFKLREAELTVLSNSQCRQAFDAAFAGGGSFIQPSMLCATAPGKGSCSGDSGGPLTTTIDGLEYQIGVVSFGLKGCLTSSPSVFARTSLLLSQQNMNSMLGNDSMGILQQLFNP